MEDILIMLNTVSVLAVVSERLRESEDLLGRLREPLVHLKERIFLRILRSLLKAEEIGTESSCRKAFKLNFSRLTMAPECEYPKG